MLKHTPAHAGRLGGLLRLALFYSGVAIVLATYDYLLGFRFGTRVSWASYIC